MSTPWKVIAGRYELTAAISSGGMGQVWRGYDTVLDRDIAVKLIRPGIAETGGDRDELIARFKREARVTARIEHAGVPAVYDAAFDADADRLFLVMQLVHGVSLTDVLAERGALPVAWAAAIAAQICAVLSHAHAVPVVHRDLKPGNIMVAIDGSVKVLDFGVAALLRNDVTRLTSTGSVIGTKPYMSPEQIQNTQVTPRSDLYSLGCLMHELLSGVRVFEASDEIALMYQHLEAQPTPLRRTRPNTPADLEALVLELLAKKPEDRPANATVVHSRLVPYLPPVDLSAADRELAPGAVPDPTRPYRRPVALRPLAVTPPAQGFEHVSLERVTVSSPTIGRNEIDAALDQAEFLLEEERFSQAADGLADLVRPAAKELGADSGLVLDLRKMHAVALFLGGDFRQALPKFDALAAAFTRIAGPDDIQALDCRRQAAYCRVELGEVVEALAELRAVLVGYRTRGLASEEEVLELRRTIVALQVGAGQLQQATDALPTLYSDARRELGSDDSLTLEIQSMMTRLGL